jgi:hypothetical protein
MTRILIALMLALTVAVSSHAQSPTATQIHTGRPVKTVRIGKVNFSYYEIPEAVVAHTTSYVSGSERTSMAWDFVALTVFFSNPGKHLIEPSCVQFLLDATTYGDGCKYKDNHHLVISADSQPLISTDLSLAQVSTNGNPKRCIELYKFSMSFEQFVQLANAKRVDMRLGLKELKLKEDHLNALRTMENGIGHY